MMRTGDRIGGWLELEHLLGRGGVGSVWCARNVFSDRLVAVKLLDPRLAAIPDMRLRFELEAAAAASLDTPHVVRVLGHGVDGSVPFLVMELLEGEDLASRLRARGRLPLGEVVSLVRQIGHALQAAHDAGVIHRDLKPGNVFFARSSRGEIVKVLDFGLAKLLHGAMSLTATGELLGTVDTMSPEQITDPRRVDARSDLWSFAVVALVALTGKKPFSSQSLGEAILAIARGPIPRASDLAPDLPPALDAFFARALQRDPRLRYQSARELVAAFEAACATAARTVSSPPPPPPPEDDDDAKTTQLAQVRWPDTNPPLTIRPVTIGTRSTAPPPPTRAPSAQPGTYVARAMVVAAAVIMASVGLAPLVVGSSPRPLSLATVSAALRRAAASCATQAAGSARGAASAQQAAEAAPLR